MPSLTNSTTSIPKATYVPLKVAAGAGLPGRSTTKSGFIRQLNLQTGEVAAVQNTLSANANAARTTAVAPDSGLWSLLRQVEGASLATQLPSPAAFSNLAESDLLHFGNALIAVRQAAVAKVDPKNSGIALNLLNTGIVATKGFAADTATSPIGMLNLERLEMTPAGMERGGLLATIPLAPKERTSVVQQEWSVTSQEFTSIVTDSLENYSETGVTENTQLSQSTNSQVSHSNQFNINASVSGGTPFVTGSSSSSFGAQDASSTSAADSRTHALQTTQKASSRVKQSHKVTISTKTVAGSSESTTRTLHNSSATDPIRIDYFSLMRKWHVALYRYGLRLTYDLTIPEPGAVMREAHRELLQLQQQASNGLVFSLQYSDITEANYQQLASQYGAQVPAPPEATKTQFVGGPLPNLPGDGNTSWVMGQMTVNISEGYAVSDVKLEVMLSNVGSNRPFYVLGSGQPEDVNGSAVNRDFDLTAFNGFMAGMEGNQTITYFVTNCGAGSAVFTITQTRTPQTTAQWVGAVWNALYNAVQQTYYTTQQLISARIAALQDKINNVDTLTLRREENDEIMKCVLRWLLGPGFEFMPQSVIALFQKAGGDLNYGVNFTGNDVGPLSLNWNLLSQDEDKINFINQAIDWDNVIYFLYSYFWDVPTSWEFIRQIQHPDSTRQAFLRAGSARVVLTVRKGWELAWTYFVEFGSTTLPDPLPSHPYLTIAQQIADYDNTNYPGIPPANPNGGGAVDDTPQVGTTSSDTLAASSSAVTITVADSTGFVAGAGAIIDTWESGVQETQTIVSVPDGTHIVVNALAHAHSPSQQIPFPVVQSGMKGLLIGEWFEYTPTSGTDIAVTSNLATIA